MMEVIFAVIIAVFLGWNLGANDAANVFGTAVGNRIIKFWTAAICASVFVILGAYFGGSEGIKTYQGIMNFTDIRIAIAVAIAAGVSVLIMTHFEIPVSMTHCIISGIVVAGIFSGNINISPLIKVLISWILNPLGAMILAFILYKIYENLFARFITNIIIFEKVIKYGLLIAGIYGSYTLGASNAANVVGIFAGREGVLSVKEWLILGGISIAFGILTFSRKIMDTVGTKIAKIDNFGALISVIASSGIVHIYSIFGVPVSTSQAIVGAVIGVGLTEGLRNLDMKIIIRIVLGWFYSIAMSGTLAVVLIIVFRFIK